MSGNLPDDVSHSDIDKHFGGSEATYRVTAVLDTEVKDTGNDRQTKEDMMDKVESALSLRDYNVIQSDTRIQDRDPSAELAMGSVNIEFEFTTVNHNSVESMAQKELLRNLSGNDVQFIRIESVVVD